jgi:hypothetical protein
MLFSSKKALLLNFFPTFVAGSDFLEAAVLTLVLS